MALLAYLKTMANFGSYFLVIGCRFLDEALDEGLNLKTIVHVPKTAVKQIDVFTACANVMLRSLSVKPLHFTLRIIVTLIAQEVLSPFYSSL